MALVLDATSGGVSANSYGTLVEAEAYFLGRPGADAWVAALDALNVAKNQALVGGALRLEQEEYAGYRGSSAQALKWPRYGIWRDGYPVWAASVPIWVKQAQFEEALALLVDPNRLDASLLAQFTQIHVGPIALAPRFEGLPTLSLTPTAARLLGDTRIGASGGGTFRIIPA